MRCILLLLGALLPIIWGQAQSQWLETNPTLPLYPVVGVAADSKGNTLLVLNDGWIIPYFSQNNGVSWDIGIYPHNSSLYRILSLQVYCVDDVFIVPSQNNVIFFSSDAHTFNMTIPGYTFTDAPLLITSDGGALFGAIETTYTQFAISTNGLDYKLYPLPVSAENFEFTAVGTAFILYNTTNFYISLDGINWSLYSLSTAFGGNYVFTNFFEGNDVIIAIAYSIDFSNDIFSSIDAGNSWSKLNGTVPGSFTQITFACGMYAGVFLITNVTSHYAYMVSKDFQDWVEYSFPIETWSTFQFYPLPNQLYAAGLWGFSSSSNLVTWDTFALGTLEEWNGLFVLSDGTYVLQGDSSMTAGDNYFLTFYATQNGSSIIALPPSPFVFYTQHSVSEGVHSFVTTAAIYSTSDFQSWTETDLGIDAEFNTVAAGNGVWIGAYDIIKNSMQTVYLYATSSLSSTWTLVFTSAARNVHFCEPYTYSSAYLSGIYVFQVGAEMYSSVDGFKWSPIDLSIDTSNESGVYSLGSYLFYQEDYGSTYISSDGTSWQEITIPIGQPFVIDYVTNPGTYIAYNHAGGAIATSSDAITWTSTLLPSIYTQHPPWRVQSNGNTWLAVDNFSYVYVLN